MTNLQTFNISDKLRPISCQFRNQMKTSLDHILQLVSKKPKSPTSKQDHK